MLRSSSADHIRLGLASDYLKFREDSFARIAEAILLGARLIGHGSPSDVPTLPESLDADERSLAPASSDTSSPPAPLSSASPRLQGRPRSASVPAAVGHSSPSGDRCCPVTGCDHVYKNQPEFGTINQHFGRCHKDLLEADRLKYGLHYDLNLCRKCFKYYDQKHNNCNPDRLASTPSTPINKPSDNEALPTGTVPESSVISEPRVGVRSNAQILKDALREYSLAQSREGREQVISKLFKAVAGNRRQRRAFQRHVDREHRKVLKALRTLRTSGNTQKAMSALREGESFPVNESTVPQISKLYVPSSEDFQAPTDLHTNDDYKVEVRPDTVKQVLFKKDPTTGAGLSGISYATLQSICEDEEVLNHLTILVNDILNGRFADDSEAKTLLLNGRGVAIKKSDGGPRPIGVGEVLLNLSLSCLIKTQEHAIKSCLSPDDYGFRTPDGPAKAVHKVNAIRAKARSTHGSNNPVHIVIIKIDISNAYGTTARMAVLRLLQHKLKKLVRPFAFTHGAPHDVYFGDIEPIQQEEGLTQGDPAAPAYSQLLYGSLCQVVRDSKDPQLLGSFFDDLFIVDVFDTAIACFEEVKALFAQANMEVNLRKTELFSDTPLTPAQLDVLREKGLKHTNEGVMIVGTPVGTPQYVDRVLSEKVTSTLAVLELIDLAARAGKMNTPWLHPQGLLHLTRNCANQLLRHLLRTIDPCVVIPHFRTVDQKTLELICHILSIRPEELTDCVKNRITLPGAMAGLGIRQYTLEAPCAFLGCLARTFHALPEELREYVPGVDEARALLLQKLPAAELPTIDQLSPVLGETDEQRSRRMSTGQRLREQVETQLLKETEQIATGHEQFFLRAARLPMAGDFLFASMSDPACRMFHYFDIVARLYLGIRVTPSNCFLGDCNGARVLGYGDHAVKHCSAKATWRHNEIRDILVRLLRTVSRSHDISWDVVVEPWLREYDIHKRADANNPADARADILLLIPERNWEYWIDVTVCQIIPGKSDALSILQKSYKDKQDRYLNNYDGMNPKQLVPLVFGSTGIWEENTITSIQVMLKALAGAVARRTSKSSDEDSIKEAAEKLYNKLYSRLRSQIAIKLAKSLGSMLNWLRWKNTLPGSLPSTAVNLDRSQPVSDATPKTSPTPTKRPLFLTRVSRLSRLPKPPTTQRFKAYVTRRRARSLPARLGRLAGSQSASSRADDDYIGVE